MKYCPCLTKAFLECGRITKEYPVRDDVYLIDGNDLDPVAVMQSCTCWIERYMGIYPNVPKLRYDGDGIAD